MEIPKQFRINGKLHKVTVAPGVVRSGARYVYGDINYTTRDIFVASRHPSTKRLVTDRYKAHTFWHEVTHAILNDMGHKLEGNEDFVDNFARRLNDVVHTAKF